MLGDRTPTVNTTGSKNVVIWSEAATALTAGIDKVLFGAGAGCAITTGSGNIILGAAPVEPAAKDPVVLSTSDDAD